MKKSSINFLYALTVYSGISVLFITVQFLVSGALIYLMFRVANLWFGPAGLRDVVYDSTGFAFLTATNTVLQYYLASLLSSNLRGRSGLFGIIFLSAAISSAFFLRLSIHSVFGSYVFAALPLIVSYLLGAVMGLLQKELDNPFHGSQLNIFRID